MNKFFDGLKVIVNALVDIIRKIGYLVKAARGLTFNHIKMASLDEIMGRDPQSQQENQNQTDTSSNQTDSSSPTGPDEQTNRLLNRSSYSEDDFMVDPLMQLDAEPELLEQLPREDGAEVDLGTMNTPDRSVDALRNDFLQGQDVDRPEQTMENQLESDHQNQETRSMSLMDKAELVWKSIKKSAKEWWDKN